MSTITRADLARTLAETLGCTRTMALQAVDALVTGLTDAIIRGNRVEIRGFGSWTVKETNRRANARNPRTGEVVDIPARRKVAFRPGRVLKEALSKPLEGESQP